MGDAHPLDRGLQRVADRRVQPGERSGEALRRDPDGAGPDPVEALGELQRGLGAALPHGVDDRADLLQRRVHVHLGAGQQPAQDGGSGQRVGTEIEAAEHQARIERVDWVEIKARLRTRSRRPAINRRCGQVHEEQPHRPSARDRQPGQPASSGGRHDPAPLRRGTRPDAGHRTHVVDTAHTSWTHTTAL